MKFFKRYFSGVDFDGKEEVKVHCPFHDDQTASASINTEKELFHCWVCDKGYNELNFIAQVNDIPLIEASKVLNKLEDTRTSEWGFIEKAELWSDSEFLEKVRALGLSDETIEKLDLGLVTGFAGKKFLGIPIYYNGVVMDVKRYNLLKYNGTPKIIGNEGAEAGLVFPFDIWKKDTSKTYILEGEKDTLAARELGINAITLTGGANAKPNELVYSAFKDREIVICYDNDDAGRKGTVELYKELQGIAKSVRYLDISEIVENEKEDFYDAVHTYGMDAFTFFLLEEKELDPALLKDVIKYTPITFALSQNIIKRSLRSVVNVASEFSDFYALPIVVTAEKVADDGTKKGNRVDVGTSSSWYFNKSHGIGNLLELIEMNANKGAVMSVLMRYCGFPSDERGVDLRIQQYETVYKYKIIDSNSRVSNEDDFDNTSIDLYSFKKLTVGKEYDLDYVIYPHPNKNQKIIAIAMHSKEMHSEDDFVIDKNLLREFQTTGSVKDRVNYLYKSAKHHIAKHLNYHMWLMEDLTFNSILEINYGTKTWGALDVFILGDTSTGKSESSKGLVDVYNFGHFLSLKTSTTTGLIGGSKKDGDGMINTIGAIPRQHRRLVVMEEFSGADPSFIKTMTDVRTTRRVHIVRVAGEMDVPCNLRMITLSNPIGDESGLPKYLSTFPNGVLPLMELINNPEDVGRYDGYLLVPQVRTRFNPFLVELDGKKIPKEAYEHKAQWVYSRKAENVIFDDGVEAYIWEKAEELNKDFESNFPLFGTKAPLKLARFSVALASLIMNTDESMQNILVTKDIVDFIMSYFYEIYDNSLFKLKDYKKEYDSYNLYTKEDVEELQNLYPKNSNILDYLEKTSTTSLENLRANSGYDSKEFNALYTKLAHMKFVRSLGRTIVPTGKFRAAMKKINREFTTSMGSLAARVTFVIEEENDD